MESGLATQPINRDVEDQIQDAIAVPKTPRKKQLAYRTRMTRTVTRTPIGVGSVDGRVGANRWVRQQTKRLQPIPTWPAISALEKPIRIATTIQWVKPGAAGDVAVADLEIEIATPRIRLSKNQFATTQT
jgi:hypothetical protein